MIRGRHPRLKDSLRVQDRLKRISDPEADVQKTPAIPPFLPIRECRIIHYTEIRLIAEVQIASSPLPCRSPARALDPASPAPFAALTRRRMAR